MFCELSYVFVVVDSFVFFYSSVEKYLLIEKISKNPVKSMRATLACLFTCVCIAQVFIDSF